MRYKNRRLPTVNTRVIGMQVLVLAMTNDLAMPLCNDVAYLEDALNFYFWKIVESRRGLI